jgi:hypothetical protein
MRFNLGNACSHSVQKLLSCCLLPRNIKLRIYENVVLPVDLYECGTWSLTLRKEHRLRVFDNRVLRRIYGPERCEVTRGRENYIMRSFITYILRQVELELSCH